jgi:segregation and condensation protein A
MIPVENALIQENDSVAELPFEDQQPSVVEDEAAFLVDLDGFEGPLDLLLDLARRQKVDLHKISVLALAEQYLSFIAEARRLRLELAADYLVMAAWLAYLKSKLLLPQGPREDEPDAVELAEALALRLQRLEAIRAAADQLVNRPRLDRDVFRRGQPEALNVVTTSHWQVSLFELLSSYARQRQKQVLSTMHMPRRLVWSLIEARSALEKLAGYALDWTLLDSYLIDYCTTPEMRRTVRASALSAMLEMVREGAISIRQDQAFAPIWVKSATQITVAG